MKDNTTRYLTLLLISTIFLLQIQNVNSVPPSNLTWQYIISQTETTSAWNTGPRQTATLDLTSNYMNDTPNAAGDWGEFTFIAYIYFDTSAYSSISATTDMWAFNIVSEDTSGGAVNLGLKVQLTTGQSAVVYFNYDATDHMVKYAQNIASRANRWWPVAITQKNLMTGTDQVNFRFFIKTDNNTVEGDGYEWDSFDYHGRNWDISKIKVYHFAESATATEYWNGKIYESVFIGKYFESSSFTYLLQLAGEQAPKLIYLIDFMEPFTSQTLHNYGTNGSYADLIIGNDNHSDYKDLQWNIGKESWSMRSYTHYLQFPTFAKGVHDRLNHTYNFHFSFISINTDIGQQSNKWELYNRWSANFATRIYGLYAIHYTNNTIRLRLVFGGENWIIATPSCGDHNSDCNLNQVELRFPDIQVWTQTSIQYYTDIGSYTTKYNINKVSISDTDIIRWGKWYSTDETIKFPEVPFQTFTAVNDQEMEVLISRIYIGEGTFTKTNGSVIGFSGSNAASEWGFDPTQNTQYVIVECTTGNVAIHEYNGCLTLAGAASNDCYHLMSSEPNGNCWRCKRQFGHASTADKCNLCSDGCIKCTGSSSTQCTSCYPGYGLSGNACTLCSVNYGWDVSTQFCQEAKTQYIEVNSDISSIGGVKLRYMPLDVDIDFATNYYDYLFSNYWLTNITNKYYLYREYTGLAQHRKVSLSFDFAFIDTNHYRSVYLALDDIWIWSFSANYVDVNFNPRKYYGNEDIYDLDPNKVY